ncbi:MAG: hypothetical protein IT530_12160 [Burkholderiales bacterium]|nr:hypothetical protein [Burkholderiales bacterium]
MPLAHDYGLNQPLRERLRNETSDDVRRATWCTGHDDAHQLDRIWRLRFRTGVMYRDAGYLSPTGRRFLEILKTMARASILR